MSDTSKRNASIDLLRLFLMFAICLQHVTCVGAPICPWLNKVSSFGVNGFILISAWYGVSFRVSKVLRLMACAAYCAAIVSIAQCLYSSDWSAFGGNMMTAINGWWFLHAYIALIMLSPLLNAAAAYSVKEGRLVRVALPLVLVLFGWSYATTLPHSINRFVPNAIGLGAPLLTVCGTYFIGRVVRICYDRGARWRFSKWYLIMAMMISLCLKILGMDDLNSPANLCVSGLVVIAFFNMRCPVVLGRLAAICAASVFSVYLFHVSDFAFDFYEQIKCFVIDEYGLNKYIVFGVMSFGILVGGLVLDVPRRVVCRIIAKYTLPVMKWLDEKVDGLFTELESKFVQG